MPISEPYPSTRKALTLIALWTLGALALAAAAGARPAPSSDLLLPFFEVDLDGGKTTYFAVVNASSEPVDVRIRVFSNWAVEVASATTTLRGEEARTLDLGDWLVRGELPGTPMDAAELEHCQAALSGQRSPRDELYYSTETAFRRAVGYVTIAVVGKARPAVLFGDYFVVDLDGERAHGDVLVDVAVESRDLCRRHGLRFLTGGSFDGDTEILIWSGGAGQPAHSAYYPAEDKAATALDVFRQDGAALARRDLDVLPAAVVKVSELGVGADFGWLNLATAEDSFVAVRYAARERYGVDLQTFCLQPAEPAPEPGPQPRPRIAIETLTNGADADLPPGPELTDGSPVRWTYRVTNAGAVRLFDVTVRDDQGADVTCPWTSLQRGESMECFSQGFAAGGQYRNVGTATGRSGTGEEVSGADPSHYFGSGPPEVGPPDPKPSED